MSTLLTKVGLGRRSRLAIWTVTASAAAVLAVGVLDAVQSHPVPAPIRAAAALTMMPATASIKLACTATISSQGRGTGVEVTCSYPRAPQNSGSGGDEPGDKLTLVVVGRDGSRSQLATWVALTGVTATRGGSTSMPIDQIAQVEIVSADDGDVLLQRSL